MADNTLLNTGTGGDTIASDDILGVKYPRSKLVIGIDGTNDGDVAATNPLPIKGTGTAGTANAGVVTIQGVASMTPVQIGDNSASLTVDNGGTFAVQVDGNALTALQLIDDAIVADDAAFTPAATKLMMAGFEFDDTLPDSVDEGDAGAGRMSANRCQYVMVRDNAGNERGLNIDASGNITANITGTVTVGSHAVTNAGTFAVQATATNAGTFAVQESGAALTALQLIDNAVSGAGFNITQQGGVAVSLNTGIRDTGTQRVTIATDDVVPASQSGTWTVGLSAAQTLATVTALTGSGVAHDAADSGNPHKIGARAALTLADDTMVANADRTDCVSDGDGTLLTRSQFPLADLISERVSNTDGAATALTNFGATVGTRNVVTSIVCFNSSASAGYIDFRDGAAGAILFTVPIPAGGGVVLPAGATPYFKTTANTALAFDVSAALTTVYISVSGFKSKVV